MYTMKITTFYIYERLLLFVGGICHEEDKEELYLLKKHTEVFLLMCF